MRYLSPSLSLPLAASIVLACGGGPSEPDPTEASIEVTSATSGPLDTTAAYTAVLDGEIQQSIGANGRTVFTAVAPGAHEIRLLGTPSTCAVAGANPRSVTVSVGVAQLHFDVTCQGAGTLVVSTITPHALPDAADYRLLVGTFPPRSIGINASLTLENVPAGAVTITLVDLVNCIPLGPNPQTVIIQPGRTSHADFELFCLRSGEGVILFTSDRSGSSHLYRVGLDGSALVDLTPSTTVCCGDWSPDGSRIVFSGPAGITVMNQDGSQRTPLGLQGVEPRWSPDGTMMAFTSGATSTTDGTIYVANADGSGVRELGPGRGPDWSPDGRLVAFYRQGTCEVIMCGANVYVMGADGTHVRRLTNSSGWAEFYGYPAWSPDGGKVAVRYRAFLGGNRIKIISLGGGNSVSLAGTDGTGRAVWAPDGSAIAFAGYGGGFGPPHLTVVPSAGGPSVVLASSPAGEYPTSWK
jgi:hypothetical protein